MLKIIIIIGINATFLITLILIGFFDKTERGYDNTGDKIQEIFYHIIRIALLTCALLSTFFIYDIKTSIQEHLNAKKKEQTLKELIKEELKNQKETK